MTEKLTLAMLDRIAEEAKGKLEPLRLEDARWPWPNPHHQAVAWSHPGFMDYWPKPQRVTYDASRAAVKMMLDAKVSPIKKGGRCYYHLMDWDRNPLIPVHEKAYHRKRNRYRKARGLETYV